MTTRPVFAVSRSMSAVQPPTAFADRLIGWRRDCGRRGLPWQGSRDPYRVWLSEIMLQQTQVATVVPYYERFTARFPEVQALAAAAVGEVMQLWAGLGYYSRARNLHACARTVVEQYGGAFPATPAQLAALPGIGRSTAAAIAAFCFDARAPILDGNVRRVLARHAGIEGDPARRDVERLLWAHAETLLPAANAMPEYTQALMDLGATVCTRTAPRCRDCPVASDCVARRTERVDVLPTPRARKKPRLRAAHWLVAIYGAEVLLLERPPAGIWGGLLAPPQFETAAALRAFVRNLAPTARAIAWPPRRNAFTHFTLEFTPHVVRLQSLRACAAEPMQCWLAWAALEMAALPTPVRALLRDVEHDENKDVGCARATR
ncbi:MAG TPA: A/G-specific adenine glycosylase [Burkholderiaceae bacterium]|nr:A/G-specific adenine glycosylase [Burkholderiaceae bacterium]